MRKLTLALAVSLTLSAAPGALASTVEVKASGSRMEAVYTAAPGEKNDVLVINLSDYALRIKDPTATIEAGPGCKSVDAHTADCEIADKRNYLYTARVLAGDNDDRVKSSPEPAPGIAGTLTYPQIVADGGPGADSLSGGEKGDELNGGGGGHDAMFGGGNHDVLTDGDHSGVDVDADTFDGGDDRDTISYAARTAKVTVRLADPGGQGEAGENDNLAGVEWAEGGSANDTLTGDAGDNTLMGGGGDDRIVAGSGDDLANGGAGRDRIYGQRGNDFVGGDADGDLLYGGSGRDVIGGGAGTDYLSCGPSRDTAVDPHDGDLADRSCESVSLNYGYEGGTVLSAAAYPVKIRHRVLTFSIGCPHPEVRDGECDAAYGKLRLRDRDGRLMGSGTLTRKAGRRSARTEKPALVRVKLTGRGSYLLHRRNGAGARVSLSGHALPGGAWSIALPHVR